MHTESSTNWKVGGSIPGFSTLHVIFGQDSTPPAVLHASIRASAHVLDKMLVGECGFSYHGDVSQEDVCALNFYFIFLTALALWPSGLQGCSLFFTEISGSRGSIWLPDVVFVLYRTLDV